MPQNALPPLKSYVQVGQNDQNLINVIYGCSPGVQEPSVSDFMEKAPLSKFSIIDLLEFLWNKIWLLLFWGFSFGEFSMEIQNVFLVGVSQEGL